MASKTAIIDIGSNSARMVVFEKSSTLAFHLIKEIKSKIRIGEGAYEKGGYLQENAMERAFFALEDFVYICNSLKCHKILCVATSALRDAPNSHLFIKKIKNKLKLNIKIINGKDEAIYGAISSLNLISKIDEATTIDIGGGSTELAKIKDGKILDTLSINIGTVRLKELFFDKNTMIDEIHSYINHEIKKIPSHFKSDTIIGIGGTIRTFSKMVMNKNKYPLKTIHGFKLELNAEIELLKNIPTSSLEELKALGVRKDRLDTIKEGCSILEALIEHIKPKYLIANGTGVREGVFLQDLLKNHHLKFPKNYNISVRSMIDRFVIDQKDSQYVNQTAVKLFDALSHIHQIDDKYKYELSIASKLHSIGRKLSFYQEHLHSFYFIINNLNYGFSHEQKILIALLTKYHTKKLPSYEDLSAYESLLPDIKVVNWLSFIIALAKSLNTNLSRPNLEFMYENHTLTIKSPQNMYISKEYIKKLVKPASFAIIIEKI